MCKFDSLQASLYKTQRNRVNVLTRFISNYGLRRSTLCSKTIPNIVEVVVGKFTSTRAMSTRQLYLLIQGKLRWI
jgi:hypothetical protein